MYCLILSVTCYWSLRMLAASPLDNILMRYETLDQSQFHHKLVKRSADSVSPDVKHVQFDSHGRHFHLYLELRQNLLSPDFRLVSVDKYNKEQYVSLDMVKFYQGVLADEPSTSEVHAFWEDDGTMTATIKTHADVYYVEPSWRHLPKSSNYSMITYKASDMKNADNLEDNHSENVSYCGFVRINNNSAPGATEQESTVPAEPTDRESRRGKRSPKYPAKNTCPLLLVADYRFFRNMGQGSVSKTAIYLIGLIERVDAIYRNTNFGPGYEEQMGFEIKEMRIHEVPSVVVGGQPHYNMERETWDTKNLLEVFSYGDYLSNFCLAHLFTALVDANNILGLSYIASPQRYNPGGICSQAYYKGKNKLYLNTGWSSSLNRYGRRLLTKEVDLVTTHELGHNWGSEHDPATGECSPKADSGGKYVMYTNWVSGYDPNNKLFSSCSRRSMGDVLASKSNICFKERSGKFCGNSVLEEGEQCDGGNNMKIGRDPCCDKDCTLRGSAICSDVNQPCCDQCQYASVGMICKPPSTNSCKGAASCTGHSAVCPSPPAAIDGTSCHDIGTCRSGTCVPLCEVKGLMPCICDKLEMSCKRCCRHNTTSECIPYKTDQQLTYNMFEGMPCIQGYCDSQGVCQKQVGDLVQRMWDIENVTTAAPDTTTATTSKAFVNAASDVTTATPDTTTATTSKASVNAASVAGVISILLACLWRT